MVQTMGACENSSYGIFMRRACLVIMLLVPLTCHADTLQYFCVVKSEISVDDNGVLTPPRNQTMVGKSFSINRKTGKIIGALFRNSTASEVKVLNRGSDVHSFEVLSVSSPTGKVTTDLVAVHEYVEKEEKPFIGVESGIGWMYSGTCK